MFLNEKQLRKLIREQMLNVLVEDDGDKNKKEEPKEEDAAMEKDSGEGKVFVGLFAKPEGSKAIAPMKGQIRRFQKPVAEFY